MAMTVPMRFAHANVNASDVEVSEAFYRAEVSPPHVRERWETEKPLRMHQLLDQLLALGMHQIDADDAINDADRNWFSAVAGKQKDRSPVTG